ncbi:hypothetical protein HK100_000805 [Physocladia obscura]|uniref:Uncharacterized protein n=1 Tax=Physocladia obscura TaxID=109957 RepID=A0AAD5SXT6_9FUNG|nr:hypothetical protein HK100_000805 [Physocladia obscura]
MNTPAVFAIIGTTGVGKSNLAIELAEKLNGEVINADSMQVYKGLDISTNKIGPEDQARVKHHLLGFVDQDSEYSVLHFERDALRVIADIHNRGKIPILVGGTHYYIQSVLWDSSLVGKYDEKQELDIPSADTAHSSISQHLAKEIEAALRNSDSDSFKRLSDAKKQPVIQELGRLLRNVDPAMAERWHPNDWRKIRRNGQTHSSILSKQKEEGGGVLRFKTCVFWLWADNKALDIRLDTRVDDMIKNGLFSEINEMRDKVRSGDIIGTSKGEIDYTRGIMQTIGFKEFDSYLNAIESMIANDTDNNNCNPNMVGPDLSTQLVPLADKITTNRLENLKTEGILAMQAATRRYARRQVTWIKNKLGPKCLNSQNVEVSVPSVQFWALDATELSKWNERVGDLGVAISRNFLQSYRSDPSEKIKNAEIFTRNLLGLGSVIVESGTGGRGDPQTDWEKRICNICLDEATGEPRLVHGLREWIIHLRSKGHGKMVKRLKRKEEFKNWQENTAKKQK